MANIEYIEGGIELLDRVRLLWEELNLHHKVHSKHFASRYENFTFEMRKQGLLKKAEGAEFYIQLAMDKDSMQHIGYCISSINQEHEGEIESLYVSYEYRSLHIGDRLMEAAINWLKAGETKKIIIGVAAGNEEVFGFYSRYGFYPKTTILEQTTL